jgi:hypothetical protein
MIQVWPGSSPSMASRRTLHQRIRRCGMGLLVSLLAVASTSCTKHVDFKQSLQVTDVSGGWFDFGIVDGKNKLVPTVVFRVRKPADVDLRSLSLNVHFKRIVDPSKPGLDGEEEAEEVYFQNVPFEDATATALLTARPNTGVTGDAPQTRAEMLQHREFRDFRARVFAKESSTKWVEILTFDLPRTLLTK